MSSLFNIGFGILLGGLIGGILIGFGVAGLVTVVAVLIAKRAYEGRHPGSN